MNQIEVRAYAKLNLSLDVLGAMGNGYHAMCMVMQTVSLWDVVWLELNRNGRFTLQSNFSFLPVDGRNLAIRAAKAFFQAAGTPGLGAAIRLRKRIPVGAGLGGGSADAAAVLRGLNTLTGGQFSTKALEELGETLGSDVPFCVAGGTRLATGRGEVLEDLPPLPDCRFVICKPVFSIRTPDLFARIDSRRRQIRPDTAGMLLALSRGELAGIARRMYNVFEDVLPPHCGEIGEIKAALLDAGAMGAMMSGTGSAVFGMFSSDAGAVRAFRLLKRRWQDCFLASPVKKYE